MTSDILHGRLDLLILKTLARGSAHGLAVRDEIERRSAGRIRVEPGALYPALHRLHAQGLASAEWGISEKGRRAKFYELTAKGRKRLQAEEAGWNEHVRAVGAVLDPEPR